MTDAPTTTLPLRPGTWTLDPLHLSVAFSIRRLGLARVRGVFTDVQAELLVGPTAAESLVTATIDMASVDTGNPDRDAHLRSPDLLDVAARPTMAFRSTAITGAGSEWEMEGDLTIGAVTHPLTFEVELAGVNEFPVDGKLHAGFEARAELRRKDFGLGFGVLGAGLGDAVKLELDVELVEPA